MTCCGGRARPPPRSAARSRCVRSRRRSTDASAASSGGPGVRAPASRPAMGPGGAAPEADRLTSAARLDTREIERVFRAESGRAVATLVRFFGDIDIAEEAVQEAFVVALQR